MNHRREKACFRRIVAIEKNHPHVLNHRVAQYTHRYMTQLSCTILELADMPRIACDQPSASDTQVLVKQAKHGDFRAREQLLRQMQDRWYRFAAANTHNHDMAMEATQETALRVLQSLDRFDETSSFATWSLGITLNVCRELKRKAAKHRRLSLLRLPWHRTTQPSHPIACEQAEHLDVLHRYLAQLTDRQREVISLRYFEHCTVEQTAQLMHIAPGTVKATLSQAIAQLRLKWSQ